MAMRIWHQSFTVLSDLPPYAAALQAHLCKVARSDTEIVMHGMNAGTYKTNYPGNDIRYAYLQYLHGQQFVLGGIAAEEQGYDAYAIMTLPEPALRETRSVINIPVVAYGESSLLTACTLGEHVGVLMFIERMADLIKTNVERMGFASRFAGAHYVGFGFNEVLKAFDNPAELLEKFNVAARTLIKAGADVIIPGEAPLCVLLAKNGISRIDDVPVLDALAATIKMAESLVDLRRSCGIYPARRGYFSDQPPRERVKELIEFYGISHLSPPAGKR